MFKTAARFSSMGTTSLCIAALALTSGCEQELAPVESVDIAWTANQQFILASSYRMIPMRTAEGETALTLEEGMNDGAGAESDQWSNEVFWRYTVIEEGLTPAPDSVYAPYANMDEAESTLTVIKADLDPQLNLDHPLIDQDPKLYMVVRDERQRLVAIVYFYTDSSGERVQEAVEVTSASGAGSTLSQINLNGIPTYIPPFPIAKAEREITLEDGDMMWTGNIGADEGSVDVVYENRMDGTLISETWADGSPWALTSITPTLSSRLLDAAEVDALRSGLPPLTEGDDAEDLSFLDALRTPIDLEDSMKFDPDMYGSSVVDAYTVTLSPERRPWAGSWWPQSEGALVFGWGTGEGNGEGRFTLSTPIREALDPLARESDGIADTLNNSEDRESEEYETARTQYREKQDEIVRMLVDYYNDLYQDLSGGIIVLEEDPGFGWGLRHTEDDWFAVLSELSPMDKFGLWRSVQPDVSGNPFFASAWELLNHYSPAGGSWWGHCNGWAAASILTAEPRVPITVDYRGHGLTFEPADLKGLLSETHYSSYSNFYGSRYYKEGDDDNDLTAEAFWKLITIYMAERDVPLVFDADWQEQVWNYPTYSYEVVVDEVPYPDDAAAEAGGLINVNTASLAELTTLPYISELKANRIIAYREANGPFQDIEEMGYIRGIGRSTLARIRDLVTVDSSAGARRFAVSVPFDYITDGVDYTHLDDLSEGGRVNSYHQDYRFTLDINQSGVIIDSAWISSRKPDFAWVPYGNATWRDSQSENPFVLQGHLDGIIGDTLDRR